MKPECDAEIFGLFPATQMCKDMDDECNCVEDKMMCQMHDPSQGKCPYVFMHPEYWVEK